jgi:hypothetical protein
MPAADRRRTRFCEHFSHPRECRTNTAVDRINSTVGSGHASTHQLGRANARARVRRYGGRAVGRRIRPRCRAVSLGAAPATGKLDAKIDNQLLIATAGSTDVSALPQAAVFTGHFWTSGLAVGAHSLVAEFQQVQGWYVAPNGPGGLQLLPNYVVVGSDSRDLTVKPQHPDLPRYNEVAFTASHNSYWVKRDNVFELEASGIQERLVDQALFEGVRSMELDLHRDDTTPHAFTVYHTDKESNSFCPQLADCLKELLVFQHALPEHDPFTLVLEFKEVTFEGLFNPDHTPADLDNAIEQYLGPYLYRPRDQMNRCSGADTDNLRKCVASAGWPTLDQLRGKFIVAVIGNYNFVSSGCALGPVAVHNEKPGCRTELARVVHWRAAPS